MQKIPTLFERGTSHHMSNDILEEATWVFEEPQNWTASVKIDGAACMVKKGRLFRRHHVKEDKPIPVGWVHWTGLPAQVHGHGWLPVREENPQDVHHIEAWGFISEDEVRGGTYELIGPKIQSNPYDLMIHVLRKHGDIPVKFSQCPRTPRNWALWFTNSSWMEGVVFKHKDGRMAKIKRKDVGIAWPGHHKREAKCTNP